MESFSIKILVYGYGNIGRQDDGLGVELASLVEQAQFTFVDTDSNYQLNIEDADNIIPYDVVIFADASVKAVAPFQFYRIAPAKEITFTTHAMAPQSVLALCEDISEVVPECYIMEMPGYEWEFNEEMTEKAKNNLKEATSFIMNLLRKENLTKEDFAEAVNCDCDVSPE